MRCPNLETLRDRQTMKWTAYDPDVLPLWIAESDFATNPRITASLHEAIDKERFGYPPAGNEVGEALSQFCAKRYWWTISADQIHLATDVIQAIIAALRYIIPDGPVVIPTPSYPPFFFACQSAHREVVTIDGLGLDAVEDAFRTHHPAAFILCSPHNPLGIVHEEEYLRQLAELAARYNVRIISDEIHAPLVYPDHQHHPTASVSDVAAERTITFMSTSKGWNVAGLRCAQVILTNEKDADTWGSLNPSAVPPPSILGNAAAIACYTDTSSFLDDEIAYLVENRDFLLAHLPEVLPGIRMSNPDATYLMWLDFSQCETEELRTDSQKILLQKAHVGLNGCGGFGAAHTGFARLNFGCERSTLEEMMDRIGNTFLK